MIQLAWKRFKKLFWPDIIFFITMLLFFVLGLILFFLFHLSVGGRVEPGFIPLLTVQDIPVPQGIEGAASGLYHNVVGWLDRPKSIFDFTDPSATYDNLAVKQFWGVVLFLADSLIGVFIILAGYQVILGGFSSRYSEALEALPNLIFAAVGANISLLFARFWIDLNNLLCGVMLAQAQTQAHPLASFGDFATDVGVAIIIIPLLILLTILFAILGVQMIARLGIILFLIILSPLLFVFLANDHTRRFGHAGLSSYVTAVLVQLVQLTCIAAGGKILVPFLYGTMSAADGVAPLVTILAGISLVWLTLRVPGLLRSWALQPVADSSRAALSLLFVAGARLIR